MKYGSTSAVMPGHRNVCAAGSNSQWTLPPTNSS
jgi:hypothetical protein